MTNAADLPPPTRRCAATGRELRPGEPYCAELLAEGAGWARKDYTPDAWPGARDGQLAWWRGKLPGRDAGTTAAADPAKLLALVDELEHAGGAEAAELRFAAAMALYRRRALKLQGIAVEGGREMLTFVRGRGRTIRVANPGLDEAALAEREAAAWARAAA